MSLAAALLAGLARTPEDDLARATHALWDRARAGHPGVQMAPEVFLPYVAARLPAAGDPATELAALHAEDLYLACACAHQQPAALAIFERSFMSRIDAYLARADALPSFTDEVKQMLRARLLVADGDLVPRIGQYTGRGPLGAWLWMTTTRVALDLRRTQSEAAPDRLALLADRAVTPDPELGYLKARYGPEFRETFREVLGSLSDRDGALLRLHFIEGVTTVHIGALYGVSRWTANRWIAEACRHVLDETRRRLAVRLGVPPAQLDTLMRLVRSELGLSLRDVLDP